MPRGNRTACRFAWAAAAVVGLIAAAPAAPNDVGQAIATIKAVTREGNGNDAAGIAWKELVGQGVAALFPTLAAIDDTHPTTANWLRLAAGAIAEKETAARRLLPADKLEAFLKDTKHAPSARRLAYELIVQHDPAAADRLLPSFLNDPQPDLRRDAVATELKKLEASARPSVKADLERLLTFARDKDQVETIAKKLEADYKTRVRLSEHFALITHWHLVGPFASSEGKALTTPHPPEAATNASDKFPGKGREVAWKPHITTDRYAIVDLNKAVGKEHDAAAYALAVIVAEKATPCEIRAASPNAVQIFLNGKKLFEREEYHHGANLDHHIGKGTLKAGENIVVLKVCQNNQTESWAQAWQFQLRVCDATGGPLPGVTQRVPGGPTIKIGFVPESPNAK